MPSHLHWPSSTTSSGASPKTIPPPLPGILASRDCYLHYFRKRPEWCPVKLRCLLSHVWVHHIWSQHHAIGSSSHVSFCRIVSRSTFFLRSTHSTYLRIALHSVSLSSIAFTMLSGMNLAIFFYQRVFLVLPFDTMEECSALLLISSQ